MAGVSEDGNAQAHVPWQLVFPATQPAAWLRLQQAADLPEGQHDMPRANSGWSGAPYDAQNVARANTARMTRPLKRNHHSTAGALQSELRPHHLIFERMLQRESELLPDSHDVAIIGNNIGQQPGQLLLRPAPQQR